MRLTYSDFVDLNVCESLKPKLRVIVSKGGTPKELVARAREAGINENDIIFIGTQLLSLRVCRRLIVRIEPLKLSNFWFGSNSDIIGRYISSMSDKDKHIRICTFANETDPRPVDMLLEAMEELCD